MDWYVENDEANLAPLRRELASYLGRHAADGSDVDGATLAASELVTNAVQNSTGPVWVSVDWGAARPVIRVFDLGVGFVLDPAAVPPPQQVTGRGLMIVGHLVDELDVTARAVGGSLVSAVLPIERVPSVSIDPLPSPTDSLPALDERRPDGTFGREAFLRALVVQLARSVEMQSGPTAAEAAVAQVGTDVGKQMEEAFRLANDLSGELETDDIARLLVELKRAIDGEFFVIDVDDERIVLGTHTCPFGDAVKQAPTLCRMTSSVFGGIARRNRGAAAVDLEQRIAVGDAQCRVTVWLRPPPEERSAFVHTYGTWEASAPAT